MKAKTIRLILGLTAILLATATFFGRPRNIPAAEDPPPAPQADDEAEIAQLVDQAVAGNQTVLAFAVFDVTISEIEFSMDRHWALVWLVYTDRATGNLLPTEPGLALAARDGKNSAWSLWLPSDPTWTAQLELVPETLLSPDAKTAWKLLLSSHAQTQGGPYGGYLLPWAAGEQKFLTQSISHGIGGSMHFSFDFAEIGFPSAMFQIYASKGGTVKWAEWTYPNGFADSDCNKQNYIVIEHTSTTPTTYSMYLHLAQDSIPEALRNQGAEVHRGQLIGTADDTGCSSGNHLHLQTHTNPFSYWGSSVDMTFDDVAINGGRPRTPAEAAMYPQYGSQGQDLYTSGNIVWGDLGPPVGGLTAPLTGDRLETGSVQISGYAYDTESGLHDAQIVAFFDGGWHDVGSPIASSPFSVSWDICSARVPDGPVSLGLDVRDLQGNQSNLAGLTHITKDFTCPPQPPACQPGASQIALFSEIDYRGNCVVLGTGDHSTPAAWSPVGDNNAASILVGTGVNATLYSDDLFQGRSHTVFADNSNLADDPVGVDQISSIKVLPSSAAPNVPDPAWPAESQVFSSTQTLDLVWTDRGGGEQFQARITGTESVTSTWLDGSSWLAGELPAGSYTWQVRSQNAQGTSPWSLPRSLTVTASPPITGTGRAVPFTEDFEAGAGGWHSSGFWHWKDDPAFAHSGSRSFWFGSESGGDYQAGAAHSGDLTSPEISIPAPGYALKFWSRAETESPYSFWDQRRVLISEEGGPFEPVLILLDDPAGFWVQSPAIDLSVYAGKTIQVRFHFATLDNAQNSFQGWIVDDIEISAYTPPSCADPNESNDSPAQATGISIGASANGKICPAGDLDYFRFSGSAGDRVVIDVDAEINGSDLDSFLSLLDSDGASQLASNDDEDPFVLHDSILGYRIQRSGSYFVKLRAWDHPGAGSPTHTYTLDLFQDALDPSLLVTHPASGAILSNTPITIQAQAADSGSGVRSVQFWWHDSDWQGGDWQLLLEDTDGSDGWQVEFDPSSRAEGTGMAFFVSAVDWAGNSTGEGLWDITIDRTAPESNVLGLPPTHQTTAVLLEWLGSDNASGVAFYDLQSKRDLESWIDLQSGISPVTSSLWFIGEPDHIYAFRSRGTDFAGNVETYPPAGDTLTFLASCSLPDSYEPDDTPAAASPISLVAEDQRHNICALQDVDWVRFQVAAGQHYRIIVNALHPTAGIRISLYAVDGSTLLAEEVAPGFGLRTELGWTALASSDLFVKLSHINPAVAGDAVNYSLWVAEGYGSYMPILKR